MGNCRHACRDVVRLLRLQPFLELFGEFLRDNVGALDYVGRNASKVRDVRAEGGLRYAFNELVEECELERRKADQCDERGR